jgi:outer membrane receptor protein involved in Fe transport
MPRTHSIDSRLRCAARASLASLAPLIAALAGAQQPAAVAPPASTLEEVVVTGSRIAAPNLTSTSPIQIVTAKEIQQGGKIDIIDLVNQLPQNFQNTGSDFSNTSSGLSTPGGITTADLRGLGPQRTLVLINGRRLGVGDPNTANPNSAPDLDQIPVALVDRIDVVTGGASAAYGSDAIGGVVNFLLKRDFEGFKIDAQIGEQWHDNHNDYVQRKLADKGYDVVSGSTHDGRTRNVNVVLGANFGDGRGNVTGYLTYLRADPIRSGDRDFGACQLNPNATRTGGVCGGSPNSNLFQIAAGDVFSVVGSQFLPWPQAGSNPPAIFNSQRFIYMSRGDERYVAGFLAHLDVNEFVKPYAELGFMTDKSDVEIAPSGLFQGNPIDPTGNNGFNVNCSNPLLSAQEAATICTPAQIAADQAKPGSVSANLNIGRRNVEGGGRESFWNHTNYRIVAGLTGTLADSWTYDAYAQYYYTTLYNSNTNYLNFQAVNNALQATRDAGGTPVCISGPPCVPWNLFRTGGVTQDQLAYLYTPGTSYGSTTQRIVHADVTAELGTYGLRSPWARDGMAMNVGAERRSEQLTFAPDAAEQSGLLSGFGGASVAIDNGYSVKDGFVELRVPLVQERPFVRDLMFDAGYRRSSYELAGGVNTYKFELQYAPSEDLRLRGSLQRAIRAPNVIELFTPQAFGLIGTVGVDPCAPTRDPASGALIPATATREQCARTGVTAAQYGNGATTNTIRQCAALQCGQLLGGNTELEPEIADSFSVGVSLTPGALPDFSATIDYWRIKLAESISTVAAPTILQNCLATGDPTYCQLIVRTAGGSIAGSSVQTGGYIVQTNVNVGANRVEGVDVQANYRWALGERYGSLHFSLAGSAAIAAKTTPFPGAPTYDCAGLYGNTCASMNPRWRHNLRVSWSTPWNLEIAALWRYVGSVALDSNSSDPSLNNGVFDAFNARMPTVNYLDLSATWDVVRGTQLRVGVNNLFDRDPPVITADLAASGAANSFPTYDQLGRQVFVAFTAKF